ncbi:hypothetical protein ABN763_04335 [Spongiivirga sp. MCCC 1A20706]|uniref:Pepco domain-containing protein n=1 Tax=Spongiivirga sp. MCCC 1A20706 TaxID=3160963 RepID=UPI003977E3D8
MDKIKIYVEAEESEDIKAALPLPNFKKKIGRMLELENDLIGKQMESQISSLAKTISDVKISSNKIKIKDVKLSLGITASGEVGLYTIAKGGLSGTSKVEITLEFKE